MQRLCENEVINSIHFEYLQEKVYCSRVCPESDGVNTSMWEGGSLEMMEKGSPHARRTLDLVSIWYSSASRPMVRIFLNPAYCGDLSWKQTGLVVNREAVPISLTEIT